MRAEIERRMGLDAINVYGLSEVIGPGVGQEYADTKDGLTVWEDHFFPEIVDPRNRRECCRTARRANSSSPR